MIEDILGPLLGVVIGGVITHVGTVRADDRRGHREQKREDRAEAREVRQAARMIHNELLMIQVELEPAIEEETWWNRVEEGFPTPSWERYAAVLAASDMDDNSWAWVAHAYNVVDDLNVTVQRGIEELKRAGRRHMAFGSDALALIRNTHVSVEQGAEFVEAYMKGEPSPAELPPDPPPRSLKPS